MVNRRLRKTVFLFLGYFCSYPRRCWVGEKIRPFSGRPPAGSWVPVLYGIIPTNRGIGAANVPEGMSYSAVVRSGGTAHENLFPEFEFTGVRWAYARQRNPAPRK